MTKNFFIPSDNRYKNTAPYLFGIEDFGEKIGGARKDLYSRISQNLASGKIDYDRLVKAGTRKDVILLAYYAKRYDVPDEDILNLITTNNDEVIKSVLGLLAKQGKRFDLKRKGGRYKMSRRLYLTTELWDILSTSLDVFLTLAQKGIYSGEETNAHGGKCFRAFRLCTELFCVFSDDNNKTKGANDFIDKAKGIVKDKERKPQTVTGWEDVKQILRFTPVKYINGDVAVIAYTTDSKKSDFGAFNVPVLVVEKASSDVLDELLKITNDDECDRHIELRDRAIKILDQLPSWNPKVLISPFITRKRSKKRWIGYYLAKEWHFLDESDAFETMHDSLKYLCDNFVDIYTKVYNIVVDNEDRPCEPYYENVGSCAYRKGPDWRNGRNATENDFLKVFGFRGVEFGNYVTQKERQSLMNKTYDALRDLCNILELEPRIVGLGGRLGLAFGARGRGGKGASAAHYEPLYNVINLTRPHGAGCIAHEWFHALDHNFVINKELFPDSYFDDRNGVNARCLTSLKAYYEVLEFCDALDLCDAYCIFTRNDDPWVRRSKRLQDGTGKKQNGKGYWTQPAEVGARCFEAYVRYKLHEKGWQNDFLSCFHYAHEHYPYPIFFDEMGMNADGAEPLEYLIDYFARLLNPTTLSKVLGEKFTSVPVTTATATSTIETTDNSPATPLPNANTEEQKSDEQPDENEEKTSQPKPDEDTMQAKYKDEMHKFFADFLVEFQKTKWAKR